MNLRIELRRLDTMTKYYLTWGLTGYSELLSCWFEITIRVRPVAPQGTKGPEFLGLFLSQIEITWIFRLVLISLLKIRRLFLVGSISVLFNSISHFLLNSGFQTLYSDIQRIHSLLDSSIFFPRESIDFFTSCISFLNSPLIELATVWMSSWFMIWIKSEFSVRPSDFTTCF